MSSEIVIRQAVTGDALQLKQCMHAAYAFYQDRMGDALLPPLELDYADEIRNYPTWVADLDGQIVGGLTMVFEAGCASIANIAVTPSVQGRGLGRRLLDFAESNAKEKGYTKMRLATHVLLTENAGLYHHLGWTEIGRDQTRIFMKKLIN